MNTEFQKSIELALAIYEKDFILRCQLFSFAWWKGRILAVGRNQAKTHSLNLRNPIYVNGKIYQFKNMCAELNLFLKLKSRTNIPFEKISIINVRLDRNLQVRMSRPCNSCFNLVNYLRPKSLYYSTQDGNFERYC